MSITENVKGQFKKIYIFPGYAPHRIYYADSFIVFVPNYRLSKIKPTKNMQTSDRYSPVYIEKTL